MQTSTINLAIISQNGQGSAIHWTGKAVNFALKTFLRA